MVTQAYSLLIVKMNTMDSEQIEVAHIEVSIGAHTSSLGVGSALSRKVQV